MFSGSEDLNGHGFYTRTNIGGKARADPGNTYCLFRLYESFS